MIFGFAMPLLVERIDWMPSPPLAPDDGPIDFAHLRRMTLDDDRLEREVLALFSAQALTADHNVHMALATAMASAAFTSSARVREPPKHGGVDWTTVKLMVPGMMPG